MSTREMVQGTRLKTAPQFAVSAVPTTQEDGGQWRAIEYVATLDPREAVKAWQHTCLEVTEGRLVMRPDTMGGVPVVKGTRIPAYVILDCLAEGDTGEETAGRFPSISADDVRAVLAYGAQLARG